MNCEDLSEQHQTYHPGVWNSVSSSKMVQVPASGTVKCGAARARGHHYS